MSTKLFIVTDLGLLRAYREFKRRQDREPHLELIKELRPQAAREKLSDQVSDKAGRLPRPGVSASDSANARRNRDDELERRLVKRLAETINQLLTNDEVEDCRLAVSKPIHRRLLDALDRRARAKVAQVVAADLAQADPKELPNRFARASTKFSNDGSKPN